MSMRDRLKTVLATIGYVAVFASVMPTLHYEGGITPTPAQAEFLQANPDDLPGHHDFTFGWSSSPLFRYRGEKTLAEQPGGVVTVQESARATVGWLSGSSLTLALGIALIWASRRLPPGP